MLYQSETALRRKPVVAPYVAGSEVLNEFEIELPAGLTAASDIIEIGMVPHRAKLTRLEITGESVGAITATVGMMDGEFGGKDAARAIDVEIATGLDINDATATVPTQDLLKVAQPADNVGLGVTVSGNIPAGGATISVLMGHMA